MSSSDHLAPIRSNVTRTDNVPKTRSLPPNTKKNFNKILDQDQDQFAGEEEVAATEQGDEKPSPMSLIGKKPVLTRQSLPMKLPTTKSTLSKPNVDEDMEDAAALAANEGVLAKDSEDETPVVTADPEESVEAEEADSQKLLSPGDLIKQANLQKSNMDRAGALARQVKISRSDDLTLETDSTVPSSSSKAFSNADRLKSGQKSRLDAQENADLSAIGAPIQKLNMNAEESIAKENTFDSSKTIKEIISQLVESLKVIQTGNKTETVVTLQYPPILAGSNISLSSLNNDTKTLDIAFTNLSPEAKRFLDQKIQDSLVKNLEEKGFAVQSIITSTLPETPSFSAGSQRFVRDEEAEKQKQESEPEEQNS